MRIYMDKSASKRITYIWFEKHMKLYCDKKDVVTITCNLVHHDKAKNVEFNQSFINEKIEEGIILLPSH